ncbi:taxadiene 5-alpha hydroxylase [Gossypium australe]|uniref:Taxadiene 5-alpha hydroxylase n=1 Tax=Gossypium australe TaxID=47621 RepID=A0A5B6VB80_9ROSI|nr:taxadiene 5-alpha hydroxylase [Gossypium australe]
MCPDDVDLSKMYHGLREMYWWSSLKCDVTNFMNRCLVFQKVKAEHQYLLGLLQSVKILK